MTTMKDAAREEIDWDTVREWLDREEEGTNEAQEFTL